MKIKLLVAVLVLFAVLSGCKKAAQPHGTVLTSISFSADIKYYNESYSADCVIDESGRFSAAVTKPENLSGLRFEFDGEKCEVNFGDLNLSDESVYMPQNSVVSTINKIFTQCRRATNGESRHNFRIKGKCDGKKYALTVSPSGLPISLEVPDLGLQVDFNNVSLLNSKVEG